MRSQQPDRNEQMSEISIQLRYHQSLLHQSEQDEFVHNLVSKHILKSYLENLPNLIIQLKESYTLMQ